MQMPNQIRFIRGTQTKTSLLVSRYHHKTGYLPSTQKGLATNRKDHENGTIRSPKRDPNKANSNSKELPKSSSEADETKRHDEYYSLKMHREGPNTESGEVDSKSKSKEVKDHNKAMGNRYDKR